MAAIRSAERSDIDGILALQARNLHANLSSQEQRDGFVTTPFTAGQIETLLAESGVFVADHAGVVAGYAFAGGWEFFAQWPIFTLMLTRLSGLAFRDTILTAGNTFQYGPICVERALRGTGIAQALFEAMRASFSARFPVGVTFINQRNQRSLAAHTRKLDLAIIDAFEFGANAYYSLAFSTLIS
jgi:GNAT superfamily N-acetyltransferase